MPSLDVVVHDVWWHWPNSDRCVAKITNVAIKFPGALHFQRCNLFASWAMNSESKERMDNGTSVGQGLAHWGTTVMCHGSSQTSWLHESRWTSHAAVGVCGITP